MAQLVTLAESAVLLQKLIGGSTRAIILVTSEKNQDGSYWCPDCEAIKPLYPILEQQASKAGYPYYIIVAGDKPTWKNPENPLRKHKALRYFNGKTLERRLVENEILDQEQRGLLYEVLE